MKNAGKRFTALNELLSRAKAAPGTSNLLVDLDGSWEVRYTPRQPAFAIIIDECSRFSWDTWKLIEPKKVKRATP